MMHSMNILHFRIMFSYQTLFKGVYMLPQANTVCINTATIRGDASFLVGL